MQKIKPAVTMELHALSQAERKSGVVLRDPPPDTPTFTLHGFRRLHPKSEWRGGRIADTDFLTLNEAAMMATRHAGHEITASDFLRASMRAEIVLFAVVRRTIQIQPDDKNRTPFDVPAPAVLPLHKRACEELANTKRAKWRSFMSLSAGLDGSPQTRIEGCLTDTEPDLEATVEECRVTGYDVHALADAFCEAPAHPHAAAPAAKAAPKWQDVCATYIVGIIRSGQYGTAKELYRALEAKAGPDSPFDKGIAQNSGSLFIRKLDQPLALKTLQNHWGELRRLAKK